MWTACPMRWHGCAAATSAGLHARRWPSPAGPPPPSPHGRPSPPGRPSPHGGPSPHAACPAPSRLLECRRGARTPPRTSPPRTRTRTPRTPRRTSSIILEDDCTVYGRASPQRRLAVAGRARCGSWPGTALAAASASRSWPAARCGCGRTVPSRCGRTVPSRSGRSRVGRRRRRRRARVGPPRTLPANAR